MFSSRIVTVVLAVLLMSLASTFAKESSGKWTKESMARRTMQMVDYFKEDFRKRQANLREVGVNVELNYEYFKPPLDRKQEREQEKFLEGRLSSKSHEEHAQAYMKDLKRVHEMLLQAEAPHADKKMPDRSHLKAQVVDEEVFGMPIQARRLGLVVDNSPSMEKYIEEVKEEIYQHFPAVYYFEVSGCRLGANYYSSYVWSENGRSPSSGINDAEWFFSDPNLVAYPFSPAIHCKNFPIEKVYLSYVCNQRDCLSLIKALILNYQADSIYWFCDLDDDMSESSLKELHKLLTEHKVKLYLHSVRRSPSAILTKVAEASGGAVIRKRL
ncbi:hypothetical protein [Persicirhabdus sediminis]|uniref:Uncharacterized protein n=1 Tax=Persicirhabdus sediminis TaxID=454144 RepID=A0A8J7MHI2_9BACT|nr:hypothetical protein [Persicirhabdus sediminis]MBK1792019.1 hypothetical protein [Persicirhabdus sediminis]